MTRLVRGRRAACTVAAAWSLLAPVAACSTSKPQLGSGPDVGFCDGWAELDALPEPPLAEKDEVLRWADGALRILDRIDPRIKVIIDRRERALPTDVVIELDAVEKQVDAFRDRVRKAGDDAAVRRAVADLSRSGFDARADAVGRRHAELCPS